ncbi:MAG: response regulator [Terriglobales bacterium]
MQTIGYLNGYAGLCTILLVEDDSFVREATSCMLKSAGFPVLLAADAVEAHRVYEERRRPVALLITDWTLPGCTGQQLGEDLRRRAPRLKILIVSGYMLGEYNTEEALTYFLAKPYSRRILIEKVEKILNLQPATIRAS